MVDDNVESQEKISPNRTKLLFHGTGGQFKEELLTEYGLLANLYNLTPSLEVALSHVTYPHGLLTFWYPQRKEVRKMSVMNTTAPSTPLSIDLKAAVLDEMAQLGINDPESISSIEMAQTVLPSSRLGAIVHLKPALLDSLSNHLPSHDKNFLHLFASQQELLIKAVEGVLADKDVEIKFLDPNLNIQKLARDIVRTDLEHYLLRIGQVLSMAADKDRPHFVDRSWYEAELSKDFEVLQEVQFKEPVYEKYRTTLITKIKAFLQ